MEMIQVEDLFAEEYERLLVEKEQYKKDAFQYQMNYISEFGELIVTSYKCKIECIQKKKIIQYCQSIINTGGVIEQSSIDQYIEKVMSSYYENLDVLNAQYAASKGNKVISEYDAYQIKRIYRRIVKKLHPDINPKTQSDEKLMDLWNQVYNAYCCNRKDELEELEVLVNKCLENGEEIHFQDLEERIQKLNDEIERIKSTTPYTYKYLLEDPDQIQQKKDELTKEIKEYESYAEELDEVISSFPIHSMRS